MNGGLTTLERREVDEFLRSWEMWFANGDAQAMAAFYAEDARLIATHVPTVHGRAAIAGFWRLACQRARAAGVERTVHLDEVESAGDLGHMRGTVTLSQAGSSPPITVRYVTLWKRSADGRWRLTDDISSAAPPAPASPDEAAKVERA